MLMPFDAIAGIRQLRRDFLRVGGGLAVAGFALPEWIALARGAESAGSKPRSGRGRAKSCILVYLLGGPPHLDMFDLKPLPPAQVRGPFRPIAPNVSGRAIYEHLPRLA